MRSCFLEELGMCQLTLRLLACSFFQGCLRQRRFHSAWVSTATSEVVRLACQLLPRLLGRDPAETLESSHAHSQELFWLLLSLGVQVYIHPARGSESSRIPESFVRELSFKQSSLRVNYVPGGQQTPLDSVTRALIDRSECLVEHSFLTRACAVLQQARLEPSPRASLS